MALPKFVVLKSGMDFNYVRYLHEEGSHPRGLLQASGTEVVSPFSKFELQPAQCDNRLVHIRSCYNNKYLCCPEPSTGWIVAGSHEEEEDKSKLSCTLFQPGFVGVFVHFTSVNTHWPYCVSLGDNKILKAKSSVGPGIFKVVDWESILILPSHVAFKGDNGMYLGVCTKRDNIQFLQFSYSDVGDPAVGHRVFIVGDGYVRIKSDKTGKFWRCSPSWIWADSSDSKDPYPYRDIGSTFWPVKTDDNVVALRHVGQKKFCKRHTDYWENMLSAEIPNITKQAKLVVEELVISRDIYNLDYRLKDARIYGENVSAMATEYGVNKSQEKSTISLKLSFTETKSKAWHANVGAKFGVKTQLKCGAPFLAEGKVEVSAEISAGYQWGQTQTSSSVVETVCSATVSPMTKVKVKLLATRGSCDVPFSYTQRETLTNGDRVTYIMHDGIFTGINCYNFVHEITQEPL